MASLNRKFKNLDKVFLNLSKTYSDNVATCIVEDIHKNGIMPYIYHQIKLCNFDYVENFIRSIDCVQEYTNILRDNMYNIIMCSIFSAEGIRLALQIYDSYGCPTKINMTNHMVACIKRHTFVFPENLEICNNFLEVFNLPEIMEDMQMLFIQDEVNLINKFIRKRQEVFQKSFIYASESSALNTLSKIMSYYKEPDVFLAKLSLPAMIQYGIDFKNKEMRDAILVEINSNSKWEFIPFIFENFEMTEDLWLAFKINIYRAYVTLPYLKTLLFHMELHKIPIETLKLQCATKLLGSREIIEELKSRGFDKFETLEEFDFNNEAVKYSASAMFEIFRKNKLDFLLDVLFDNYGHVNKRIYEERHFIAALRENNLLGWDDKMLSSYDLYQKFLDNIFKQMSIFDKIILEFNSFICVKNDIDNTVSLRAINSIVADLKKITCKKILKVYHSLIGQLEEIYMTYLNNLKKEFNIEAQNDIEEEFNFMYQNSYFRNVKFDYKKILRIKRYYENIGNIHLSNMILKSMESLCHPQDIKDILYRNDLL